MLASLRLRRISVFPHAYAARRFDSFPKDTTAEQIEALTDEDYVFKHLILHAAIVGVLAITAIPTIQKQNAAAAKVASVKVQ